MLNKGLQTEALVYFLVDKLASGQSDKRRDVGWLNVMAHFIMIEIGRVILFPLSNFMIGWSYSLPCYNWLQIWKKLKRKTFDVPNPSHLTKW